MEEVVDSLKRRGIIVSFSIIPILLLNIRVWNFWSFKYPIFHVRNETPCTWALMYVHTWLARDSFPELAFFSPFPQQCQLLQSISFRWNGEFEFRSIHAVYERSGRETRWICLFVSTFSRNLVSPSNRS